MAMGMGAVLIKYKIVYGSRMQRVIYILSVDTVPEIFTTSGGLLDVV